MGAASSPRTPVFITMCSLLAGCRKRRWEKSVDVCVIPFLDGDSVPKGRKISPELILKVEEHKAQAR